MPDQWETLFGLDINGPGDAGLDSDSDGVSNLQEYQRGSHPKATAAKTRYFAEGAANAFFTTRHRHAQSEHDARGRGLSLPRHERRDVVDHAHAAGEVAHDARSVAVHGGAGERFFDDRGVGSADGRRSHDDVGCRGQRLARGDLHRRAVDDLVPRRRRHARRVRSVLPDSESRRYARRRCRSPTCGSRRTRPIVRSYNVGPHSRTTIWVDRKAPSSPRRTSPRRSPRRSRSSSNARCTRARPANRSARATAAPASPRRPRAGISRKARPARSSTRTC